MKRVVVISAILFIAFAGMVNAQQLTPMQLKEARIAAYKWVKDYNLYARLEERRSPEQKFYSLFVSEELSIPNDYLPSIRTKGKIIALHDYAAELLNEERIYDLYFTIGKAHIIKEAYDSGIVYIDMQFVKTVEFVDRNNMSDTSYAYPKVDITLVSKLRYNINEKYIAAESLTSDTLFDRILILHDAKQIPANKYTNQKEIDNECRERSTPLMRLAYDSVDIDKQIVRMSIDTIKNNFHIGGSVGANLPTTNSTSFKTLCGLHYDVYVGYYRQFILKGDNRFGIEINVGYSSSGMGLEGSYNERYSSVDPDGGVYERRVDVSSYKENICRYSVEVPLALRYDRILNKNLSLFVKLGASASYDFKQVSVIKADAKYSGYYSWLFDVVIDQNGIYDFGTFNGGTATLSKTALDKVGVNVFAGIGLQHFLSNTVSLEYSLQYKNMVYNKMKSEEGVHLTDHNGDWSSATNFMGRLMTQDIYFNIQLNFNF